MYVQRDYTKTINLMFLLKVHTVNSGTSSLPVRAFPVCCMVLGQINAIVNEFGKKKKYKNYLYFMTAPFQQTNEKLMNSELNVRECNKSVILILAFHWHCHFPKHLNCY